METGNPKQVAILAVLAVGAFGFLFTRISGKSLPNGFKAIAEATTGRGGKTERISTPLTFDPFSHPKLIAEKTPVTESAPIEGAPMPSTDEMKAFIGGPLPVSEPLPNAEAAKSPTEKPIKPPEGTTFALEATAGATDAVAFLSVGGAESKPFRTHDLIKGKVRLLRIEDGAVVLSGPKGELTINVGEQKRI